MNLCHVRFYNGFGYVLTSNSVQIFNTASSKWKININLLPMLLINMKILLIESKPSNIANVMQHAKYIICNNMRQVHISGEPVNA